MAVNRAKRQSFRALWVTFLLVLATLACESETAVNFIEPIPTPIPTSEPTPENADPNYVITLPQEVKSSSGWAFTIHRVELLAALDGPEQDYLPQRGLYLWLVGTVGNFTGQHECIRGQEFTLRNDSALYKMSVEHAEVIHKLHNLAYPDSLLGHCLDADQSAESFLIFDIPREAGDLWLELGDSKVRLGRMARLIQAMPPSGPAPADARPEERPKPFITAEQNNVNIRGGPGVSYTIIGRILIGQSYEVVGRNADSSWWQISTPNGLGWVAAKVTTASNVDDRIPIVGPVQ